MEKEIYCTCGKSGSDVYCTGVCNPQTITRDCIIMEKEEMKPIPTQEQNPKGLHQRYAIKKIVPVWERPNNHPERVLVYRQVPVDKGSEYFVLRLDSNGKDPNHINACRIGIQAYAKAIEPFIPELSKDLQERYPTSPNQSTTGVQEVAKSRYPLYSEQLDLPKHFDADDIAEAEQHAFKAGAHWHQEQAKTPDDYLAEILSLKEDLDASYNTIKELRQEQAGKGKSLMEMHDEIAQKYKQRNWNDLEDFQKLILSTILIKQLYATYQQRQYTAEDMKRAFDAGYIRGDGQCEFNGESRTPTFEEFMSVTPPQK